MRSGKTPRETGNNCPCAPDIKTGAIIGCAKRSEHFKEIVQRIWLTWHHALGTLPHYELGKQLRHVIRDPAILDVGAAKHMSNQDVKIKAARDV
jgi:hypothetical protein